MNIFQVVVLSVVEGITEFLPVSSTGHLILTASLLKIPPSVFFTSFEIIIQLGAIFAVIFIYWKKLIRQKALWLKILSAFIPSAVIGYLLYKIIKTYLLTNPMIPIIALTIGGLVLIFCGKFIEGRNAKKSLDSLELKKAFAIGMFQVLSIVPGVSRSASTIVGGMLVGLSKKDAAEFSFLLAIPTMFAATAHDLNESRLNFSGSEFAFIALGVFLSFISALIGIKFLIKFVENHSFSLFGIYRILIALLFYIFLI